MRKLLLGLFLGLLAVVHSTPVTTVTQVPVNNEDEVFREAMTDGFLVPSLTTETPKTQSTIEASQHIESTSNADDVSRGSSLTAEAPKTNATVPASQQPDSEEVEGSTEGVTDDFWHGGYTTTTSTQEPSSATESITTTSTQEPSVVTESTTTTSTQEPSVVTESTTTTSTQEASIVTESTTTTSTQEPSSTTESTTTTSTQEASIVTESTTTTSTQEPSSTTESTTSTQEASSATEPMTSEFDYIELPTETTTVEASQQPFSIYWSEGSGLGESEDMSTTFPTTTSTSTDSPVSSLSHDFGSGDEEFIHPATVDSLGSDSGSGMIGEPTVSKVEGRLDMGQKPEKVVEEQDPEQHKGHTTPGWIIIVGFIVGVAALVMLCLAIATRDKWNGPSQASTTKTESNPSNQQRGLEMETFLPREEPRENGKAAEYTVIPLDELSESYS